MARRPTRHIKRNLRRNPSKGPIVLGVVLVGGVAAWWLLSDRKKSGGPKPIPAMSKPDMNNLPRPPGCTGDFTVAKVEKQGSGATEVTLVQYKDGRYATYSPMGGIVMMCGDKSTWSLAPGHPWFQVVDSNGVNRAPPWA